MRTITALLSAIVCVSLPSAPRIEAQETVHGRLVGLVIDHQDKTSEAKVYVVDDATGKATELLDAHRTVAEAGGLQYLNGASVTVAGTRLGADRMRVSSVRETTMRPRFDGPSAYIPSGNAVLGAQKILTLLCQFPDLPPMSQAPAHFARVTGNTFPGVGAFVTEASNGLASLAGSMVSQWVTLSKPSTHYFGSGTAAGAGFTSTYVRDATLAEDCATAAQAGSEAGSAHGITLQINYNPGASYAYLGPLPLVGPTLNGRLRLAIMANWAATTSGTYAHEVGHTFGLLHSGSTRGAYDSKWDVMSWSSPLVDAQSSLAYGAHFNGNHKAFLRWTTNDRIAQVARGDEAILTLRTSTITGSGVALITVADPTDPAMAYFTLEARTRSTPFEQAIPHEGVVIHAVKKWSASFDNSYANNSYAMAVDGGNVNDAGAVLIPGRHYEMAGMRFDVTARNGSEYTVKVTNRPVFSFLGDSATKLFVGMSFRDTIRVAGAPTGAATVSVTGAFPPGVTYNPQTRAIVGAPASTGSFKYTITATSGAESITRQHIVDVVPGGIFKLPDSRTYPLGALIADTLAAYPVGAGWPKPVRWLMSGGINGMFFQPRTIDGRMDVLGFAGTPTTPGTYRIAAGVDHALGRDTLWFSVVVGGPAVTVLGDSTRRPGVVGVAYADTLRATTTSGTVTWSLKEGQLPRGITLDQSGRISGVPDSAGTYRAVIDARSGPSTAVTTVTKAFLVVVATPSLVVSVDSIRPPAIMGAHYSDSLAASSPYATVKWQLSAGALPSGVTLDPLGRIRGVAESAGEFRGMATASVGPPGSMTTAVRPLIIRVGKPNLASGQLMDALLGGTALQADLARFLDLLGNRNGRVDVGDAWAWLVDSGVLQPNSSVQEVIPALENATTAKP